MYNIYVGWSAMAAMRIDLGLEQARIAEKTRLLKAERQQATKIFGKIRSREDKELRVYRAQEMEKKKMEEYRAEAMEEERIKKQTLAPLPAVADRKNDIPLSEYKYHDNVLKAAGNYNIGDATAKAFFNDAYTRDFIDTCYINVDKFNGEYYHLICGADSIWAWGHEQMETIAFNSREIMEKLIITFGLTKCLKRHPTAKRNFRLMRYYFKEWREAWNAVKDVNYKEQSAEDNLWSFFRYWFCYNRMGALLCYRADLVKSEFEFASKPATRSNREPSYPLKGSEEVEDGLMILYKYEKGLKVKRGAVKRDDSKKMIKKRAFVHTDDDDEKREYEPAHYQSKENKINDEDDDIIDDNLTTTAGGYHQAISDVSPPNVAKRMNDNLKERYFKQAGANKNVELKDKDTRQAGGNIIHGKVNEEEVQAVIKDDRSNQGSKAGDKYKDIKTGDEKADDRHKNGYSDEEEDDEYDVEWNIACPPREEAAADDDDMSLCEIGRTSSEYSYSVIGGGGTQC